MLFNIGIGRIFPDEIKLNVSVLLAKNKGAIVYQTLINERLQKDSTRSIWAPFQKIQGLK